MWTHALIRSTFVKIAEIIRLSQSASKNLKSLSFPWFCAAKTLIKRYEFDRALKIKLLIVQFSLNYGVFLPCFSTVARNQLIFVKMAEKAEPFTKDFAASHMLDESKRKVDGEGTNANLLVEADSNALQRFKQSKVRVFTVDI